jgi:hypothetical protein
MGRTRRPVAPPVAGDPVPNAPNAAEFLDVDRAADRRAAAIRSGTPASGALLSLEPAVVDDRRLLTVQLLAKVDEYVLVCLRLPPGIGAAFPLHMISTRAKTKSRQKLT